MVLLQEFTKASSEFEVCPATGFAIAQEWVGKHIRGIKSQELILFALLLKFV